METGGVFFSFFVLSAVRTGFVEVPYQQDLQLWTRLGRRVLLGNIYIYIFYAASMSCCPYVNVPLRELDDVCFVLVRGDSCPRESKEGRFW